ncbi:MAG: hypothetical protein KAX49_07725 [Halanaerobiales bacterium]|nr:hypothetical protein [Halanaerobiales bacterium]
MKNHLAYEITSTIKNNKSIDIYIYTNGVVANLKFEGKETNYAKYIDIAKKMINSFRISNISYKAISDIIEKEWNKYVLNDLEFYYPNDSLIYDEIEEWAEKRIEAFNYILDNLKTKWNHGPIKIYVFNDHEHGRKYGVMAGIASVSVRKIFTTYKQSPGHELTHIISCNMNNLEFIKSLLIIEGLASYLNMDERDKHMLAAGYLRRSKFEVKLLGENFIKTKHAYDYGGSFVKYLIGEYGIDFFKDFFSQNKFSERESFKYYYGKSGEELINEWKEDLKDYNPE